MQQSYIERTSGIKARDKIGYAMGDLASCLVFGLTQSILNKYYTDVLEVSVLSVMIMTVVARIWDAINDPIWGRIIDGAKVRADGRYRHWIKVFAIPTAVAAVLMFADVRGFSSGGKIAWIYFSYILFGMLYTCINIPYGSLAQVITSSDKERSSLPVFRSIGSTFGAMPAMVLASMCYVKLADGSSQMDYRKVLIGSVAIAVLSVVTYFLCYAWTKERVETRPAPREKGQTMQVIRILLKSRPFMAACLASGVGTAFIFLLVWALTTDAIDYNKVTYGLNDEATSYAFYSFMRKLGSTVATILINVPLLRIGYSGSKLNTEGLTLEALKSMYNSSVMIPALLFLSVFLILRYMYPLSKQRIDQLQLEKEKVLGGQ